MLLVFGINKSFYSCIFLTKNRFNIHSITAKYILKPENAFYIIFFIRLFERLGITEDLIIFKSLSIILTFFILNFSIKFISNYTKLINYKGKILLLTILIVPLISVTSEIIYNLSFKNITDAYFIKIQYFYLFTFGLCYSVLVKNNDFNFIFNGLEKYSKRIFIPVISLFLLGIFKFDVYGDTYLILDSFLIPGTFLIFSNNKSQKYIGFLFAVLALFLLAFIGSRSYFIVVFLTLLIYMISYFKRISYFKVFFNSLIIIYLALITNLNYYFSESFLAKKINFSSLYKSYNSNMTYDGDSRSEIFNDAFFNLTEYEFYFGKGFFGLYDSFVLRNTIEIGWIQIVFWAGAIYGTFIFLIHVFSFFKNFFSTYQINVFFGSIIFIRIVDGFIYGMPQLSIYNFLIGIGVFLPFVKRFKQIS